MGRNKYPWVFYVVIVFGVLWILGKVNSPAGLFGGLSPQRGLQGTDQFGNPLSPQSTGILSS